MNKLVDFSLKNKLAIWIMTVIMMCFGIYNGLNMKLESLPNMNLPYVVVTTVYPGATAEQVDDDLSSKVGKILENIENVKTVKTTSYNNFSMVFAEFKYGVDTDSINSEVEKEIKKLDLPETVQESSVLEINMNSMPVLVFDLTVEDLSNEELSELVEGNLLTEINKISGIGEASVSGLSLKEAVLNYNENAMNKYSVDKESLLKILEANNVDIPLGLIDFKTSKESVLVNSNYDTLADLMGMTLPFLDSEGNNLKLKDLVSVEETELSKGISRTNGIEGLSIAITKGNSANTVEVVNEVKKSIEEFSNQYEGTEYVYVLDQGKPIEDSVAKMLEKALFGAFIAVVIIMIFLRDWKSTLISVISIPLSLLLAISGLKYMGITLNMMTLAAMTVAIGRVIDDSIVVVENIYRRLGNKDEALYGRELIRKSTLQMFIPIFSSTVVTVVVFAPMVFVGGMVGELFMPFALTMAFSLFASLLVAVTVVPVMAHTLFKKALYSDEGLIKVHKESKSKMYQSVLEWSLNHKLIIILTSILLVCLSGFLLTKVGFTFMGEEESNQVSFKYEVVNGELDSTLERNLEEVESYLLNGNKDVEVVKVSLDDGTGSMMSMGKMTVTADVTYSDSVKDYDKASEIILSYINKLGHKGVWKVEAVVSPGAISSGGLSYSIYGNNLNDIESAVKSLEKHLNGYKQLEDVESALSNVYKENILTVDEDKAAMYGLTTGQVGMSLFNLGSDKILSNVKNSEGISVNVVEKAVKVNYDTVEDMLEKDLIIIPGTSKTVKVKDVVTVSKGTVLSEVTKENGRWVATVTAKIKTGNISDVNGGISKFIKDLDLPLGVVIDEGGVGEQMKDSFVQLGLAMLAAIALVYLILVLTFKEGLAPFVILMSLPVSIIGVVLTLLITGNPLDISGMLGLLMLIGVVVTNAIVMVDRILENEYSGKDLRESIVEACLVRLRPILMTAIATIGTLLPLVFGETVGLIGKGLALTVIGGLISSTILTLVVVPVMYELMSKLFRKDRKNNRLD